MTRIYGPDQIETGVYMLRNLEDNAKNHYFEVDREWHRFLCCRTDYRISDWINNTWSRWAWSSLEVFKLTPGEVGMALLRDSLDFTPSRTETSSTE